MGSARAPRYDGAVQPVDEPTFLHRPAGRMVLGRRWVYGSPDGVLFFSLVFGALDESDVATLTRLWRVELATGGHLSLFDASALSSVTPTAFGALGEFLSPHAPKLARTVRRQAVVRPSGIAGAMVAGYYNLFPPPYPYQLFAARGEALAWLELPDDALAAADHHVVGEPLLAELRRRLVRARPDDRSLRSIERVARELGVATRSLQRRLQRAGTSFQAEVKRAQIERAMELMTTSDEKLATIARAVGCASLTSFSEMFAREVGTPPSAWRAAHRPKT